MSTVHPAVTPTKTDDSETVEDKKLNRSPAKASPRSLWPSRQPRAPSLSGEYIFKLVVIGDTDVGKSCLVTRFANGTFTDAFETTIGVDFRTLNCQVDDTEIKLQLWDTAGQERFRTVTSSYYKGADGIVLVYDLTHRQSFENVSSWLEEANKHTDKAAVAKILVGSKSDVAGQRQVTYREAQRFAKENRLGYLETSSMNGENVEDAFKYLVRKLIKHRRKEERRLGPNVAMGRLQGDGYVELEGFDSDDEGRELGGLCFLFYYCCCYCWGCWGSDDGGIFSRAPS